ncbi:hypothetical protein ARSEF1564_001119 [Beauveria bassiana]
MAELQNRWVNHLRNNARQEPSERNLRCLVCAEDILPDIDAFRAHIRADEPKHSTLTGDADIVEAFRKMSIHPAKQRTESTSSKSGVPNSTRSPPRKPSLRHLDDKDGINSRKVEQPITTDQPEPSTPSSKPNKARSPPSSPVPAVLPLTTPIRSHRRNGISGDFDRGDAAKHFTSRQLWNPDEPKSRGTRVRTSAQKRFRHHNRPSPKNASTVFEVHAVDMSATPGFTLFRQPETKPISQEQLTREVQDIYSGLTLVEHKCIELSVSPKTRIREEQALNALQYQKLIGLHRALLHEHHDFFLATQHPVASAALRRLPLKYSMLARMWRHGIQSFLELLRKRLPGSREHMLTFIYIAYSTMTLLYETVPFFVATWIECLGDLSRYRMAIEDDDIRDREIWTSVSRNWYSKASDRSPEVGRLYHHLAILARPDPLQQLYYYGKALSVPVPFPSAGDSIMTLFNPVLERSSRLDRCDEVFIRVHAILFSGRNRDQLEDAKVEFLDILDRSIAERKKDWLRSGTYIAISLICSLFGYGANTNPLKLSLPDSVCDVSAAPSGSSAAKAKNVIDEETASRNFDFAASFAMQTCNIVFRRKADINVLPFLHIMMLFLHYVAQHDKAMSLIQDQVPWRRIVDVLNEARPALLSKPRMANKSFPRPPPNEPLRPLSEDYALRGLGLSKDYFPDDWFSSDKLEEDEKMFEPPSLGDERRQRILWLGRQMCNLGKWLDWEESSKRFIVNSSYDRNIGLPVES